MSLNAIFDIAASAMTAETVRLTTSAGNMSNANVEAGSPDEVYQAKYPVFKSVQENANQWMGEQIKAGVKLDGIYESDAEPHRRYDPNSPIADNDGFVYTSNINYVEEMANIISASRSYQMNIELLNTTKQLMQRTLQLGE
ncbi:Putative proximal rod protein [Legionella pneumophila]|uniref:flagellar basal body rod protein FlgC n=1 Tax=Legionella pneumophila TaxID=446 RepID=UPI0007709275|nr:flagellar basal body rod protein FlgC [Legionella pneumophila]CZH61005.1 Putative proximal rod protein [Legionella pneumophila]CZI83323.1 Putative proximal rod protein [Legionella pneumophila]